jgi:uncharacterized protein (DUF58 family)
LVLAWDPSLWGLTLNCGALALAALGADALLTLPVRRLSVEVTAPSRLPIGDAGKVTVKLATLQTKRAIRFDVLLEATGEACVPPLISLLTENGQQQSDLSLSSSRRGVVTIEAIWLRWRGPFGLVERRKRQVLELKIDVVPTVRGTRSAALELMNRQAMFGSKAQRQRGEGAEFERLRDHTAGLDNRFIDWKHSARHRKLLSKEFRIERNHQVVLAFDTGHLMVEPIEGMARLDHAIEAGLLLGWVSLRSGDLVGSYGFDTLVRHYQEPGRGIGYLARIQRAAARLEYRSEETNFTLGLAELNARLKRRALVILFTEFVDSISAELLIESLQRMANHHAVIFVTLQDPMLKQLITATPSSFDHVAQAVVAHDFQRERAVVLERIARLGIYCLDVPVRGLSMSLINRYFDIKQKGLI